MRHERIFHIILAGLFLLALALSIPHAQAVSWAATGTGCWTATEGTDILFMWNATGTTTFNIPNNMSTVWYTVVGGGASGGGQEGGGGGAGEFRNSTLVVTKGSTVTVTVGAGGDAGTAGARGKNGTSSVFSTVTSIGGGAGAGGSGQAAFSGGSGGGGSFTVNTPGSAVNGNAFGRSGGTATDTANYGSGGGGGAGAAGGNGSTSASGAGGNGNTSAITGASVTYAGGGGGGSYTGANAGAGGSGGGGAGAKAGTNTVGFPGTDGLGGGGGGGANPSVSYAGGKGGSGVVIIRYTPDAPNPFVVWSANVSSGLQNLAVQFTDESYTDITNWLWDFDNGNTSTDQSPLYTFYTLGAHHVTLNVTNASGYNLSAAQTITVLQRVPPIVNFTTNVSSGRAPLPIAFTSTSVTNILSYLWTFGSIAGNTSTDANPSFLMWEYGDVPVTLMVTNASASNTTTLYFPITAPPDPPLAMFTPSTNKTVLWPAGIKLTSAATGEAITNVNWSWGDGTYTESLTIAKHIYVIPGKYHINMTATNLAGSTYNSSYIQVVI